MLKFKFNYLHNTLAYQKDGNIWHQIPEEKQFAGHFDSQGFKLENGWISFTIYENKIRAFYKEIEFPNCFTYYRKDLPKECLAIFTFTEADLVEKNNGKWTKKGEKPWEY